MKKEHIIWLVIGANLIWTIFLTFSRFGIKQQIRARQITIVNDKNQDRISLWSSDADNAASITFYDIDGEEAMRLYNFYDTERCLELSLKTSSLSAPSNPGIKIRTGAIGASINLRGEYGEGTDMSAGHYKEYDIGTFTPKK